jgi:drug/metabolite transporter superfamily protein YnfA
MTKRKNLKRVFFVLIAIAAVTGLYAYKEFNRKNKSLHDVEAVASLKTAEIIAQFSNDEKKATAAYSGKAIVVNGMVKTIDKDEKGFYTIVLGESGSMSSVRCSIDSTESSQAVSVQNNSMVKIKGICTGYNADEMGLGSDVILNRCVIETAK